MKEINRLVKLNEIETDSMIVMVLCNAKCNVCSYALFVRLVLRRSSFLSLAIKMQWITQIGVFIGHYEKYERDKIKWNCVNL